MLMYLPFNINTQNLIAHDNSCHKPYLYKYVRVDVNLSISEDPEHSIVKEMWKILEYE